MKLYKGNNTGFTCHQHQNIGAEYQCPIPTIGGPWIVKKNKQATQADQATQGVQATQAGGNDYSEYILPDYIKCTYTATGQFKRGRKHIGNKFEDSKMHISYIPYNNELQYGKEHYELPGVNYDLTQPVIGNRPVHNTHFNNLDDQHVMSYLPNMPTNLTDRKLGCRQPFWNEQCY